MQRDLRFELYLALLLLGADPMLLGSLAAWRDSADDGALVVDLANWNEAKVLEMKEWLPTMTGEELEAAQARIRQYEEARGALSEGPRQRAA
jgi:hypothetical protein